MVNIFHTPQNFFYITLIFFSFCSLNILCQNKTLFVFEHFRHGARAPWRLADKENNLDIFGEEWNGEGELTPSGLRMHYLLGHKNYQRYKDFISSSPNLNEILVYSTSVNRTILSVYAHLQGMYPSQTGKILTESQFAKANELYYNESQYLKDEINALGYSSLKNNISLIPVHIFDDTEREIKLNENDVCPGMEKYKNKNYQSKEGQNYLYQSSHLINSTYGKELFKYFNLTDPNYYYDRASIYVLADTYISDYFDKRPLTEFSKTGIDQDQFYIDSAKVVDSDLFDLEYKTENDVIIYVGMSPTFRRLLDWMDKRINLDKAGKTNLIEQASPKMVIYSGHDTTVGLMSLFVEKVFGFKAIPPTFAANQYFELYKNEKNDYFVRYIFNDDELFSMDYNVFKQDVEKVLWTKEEINAFCDEVDESNSWEIVTYIMIGIVLALIVVIIYLKKTIN